MTESFTSFIDTYKSKIKNPLIGTMISVWIFHNWKIVYSLFNFDKDCTMQDKINYIQNYFSKKEYFEEIWTITWIAFIVIILTFSLLAISRGITDGYYKIIEPWIKSKIDKHENFTQDERIKLMSKIESLNLSLDTKRSEMSRVESENHNLTLKIDALKKRNDTLLTNSNDKIENLKKEISLNTEKNIYANKVVTFFDDIINALNPEIKKEIIIYIEHKESINKNQYKNFIGLKNELQKIGIIIDINGETKTPALGILFLEYFKMRQKDELPF